MQLEPGGNHSDRIILLGWLCAAPIGKASPAGCWGGAARKSAEPASIFGRLRAQGTLRAHEGRKKPVSTRNVEKLFRRSGAKSMTLCLVMEVPENIPGLQADSPHSHHPAASLFGTIPP